MLEGYLLPRRRGRELVVLLRNDQGKFFAAKCIPRETAMNFITELIHEQVSRLFRELVTELSEMELRLPFEVFMELVEELVDKRYQDESLRKVYKQMFKMCDHRHIQRFLTRDKIYFNSIAVKFTLEFSAMEFFDQMCIDFDKIYEYEKLYRQGQLPYRPYRIEISTADGLRKLLSEMYEKKSVYFAKPKPAYVVKYKLEKLSGYSVVDFYEVTDSYVMYGCRREDGIKAFALALSSFGSAIAILFRTDFEPR